MGFRHNGNESDMSEDDSDDEEEDSESSEDSSDDEEEEEEEETLKSVKRKIGHQEAQEENLSKRQKNIVKVEEESGESVYYDLNNSLETGYTSDVYSDLEDSNEIYSDPFIASY